MALPDGCYGRIAPRSGLAARHHIDIGAGVVDKDYRGEETHGNTRDVTRGFTRDVTRDFTRDVTRGFTRDLTRGITSGVTHG